MDADKRDALIAVPFIGVLILAALLTDGWLASVGLVILPAVLGLLVLGYRVTSRREGDASRRVVVGKVALGFVGALAYFALAVGVFLLVTEGV
jgi:hypothetical protein